VREDENIPVEEKRVAWAISFWEPKKNRLPKHIPSIFSNEWYWDMHWEFWTDAQWVMQLFEIQSENVLKYWIYEDITYCESDEFVIGSICLEDSSWDELMCNAERAYNQIYECMKETWKSTLLRVWNYVTDILKDERITVWWERIETNRYRIFCSWRSKSIDAVFWLDTAQLPTATWIGNFFATPSLKIFFIATNRKDVWHHINPQQTNPSDYDVEKHGILELPANTSTPRFNRSSSLSSQEMIFVGWTASILWSEVVYPDDIEQQTIQSLKNINYTIEEAQRTTGKNYQQYWAYLKVFIKHKKDYKHVKSVIESSNNPLKNIIVDAVYTHADVCREWWLVEISLETVH